MPVVNEDKIMAHLQEFLLLSHYWNRPGQENVDFLESHLRALTAPKVQGMLQLIDQKLGKIKAASFSGADDVAQERTKLEAMRERLQDQLAQLSL
jgi:hypothetical protein